MKYRLTRLLTLALILSLCASCGSVTPPDDSTAPASTTSAADTEPAITSGVPAGMDLGEEEINIWSFAKAASAVETFVDIAGEMTGDVLDDAVFNLNRAVEERLRCDLIFHDTGASSSETADFVKTMVLADDTAYDLYHVIQYNAAPLAADGIFLNIADAPYLSLDERWWDGAYMKEMTVSEDHLFALVGDYAIDRTRCLSAVFYNKALYNDFYGNPDGLYEEVLEGKWTYDRLREISAEVYSDLNNNGKTDMADRLGFPVNGTNNMDALFYGADVRVTERGDDDIPSLVLNSEHTIQAVNKLYSLVYETEGGLYSTAAMDNLTHFIDGKSMFHFAFFYTAEAMRDMRDDYGIVPMPKLDETQENYVSTVHDIMRMMVLPANCTKVDSVCAVLEEMSFEGWQNLLPVYYEVALKDKYVRDDASAAMLDLIRDTCRTDIAYVYRDPFGNMGYITRKLIQNEKSDFASEYAANESFAKDSIDQFVDKFLSVE